MPEPIDVVEALLFASDTPVEAERIQEVLDLESAAAAREIVEGLRTRLDAESHALLQTLSLQLGAETYVVADDQPAPQGDVIRYLAARLGVPVPESVALESAPETLRHDRRVDASRFKRDAQLHWRFPTYREGFEACLRAEAGNEPG